MVCGCERKHLWDRTTRTFDDAVADCRRSVARVAVVTTRLWRLHWMKIHGTSGGCLWWPWGVRIFIVQARLWGLRSISTFFFKTADWKARGCYFTTSAEQNLPTKKTLKIWPEFFCVKFKERKNLSPKRPKPTSKNEEDTPAQTQSLS